MSFEKLGLIAPLLDALANEGYTMPTPIQQQAIPIVLQQRDLLGCAQTGTGKTAAFALPLLQLLHLRQQEKGAQHKAQRNIKALILTPTRELAIQIGDSFAAYGRHMDFRHLVIFGGVSQHPQTLALKKGVDILIATPGRLLDLIQQRFISLQQLQFFVLDEADRMLDMGFVHDVKRILTLLPAQRQSLFFSATMPPEIQKLANAILNNPAKVEVTPVSSTADTITQWTYFVERNDKRHLLQHILRDNSIKTVLVFTRTKHGADRVAKDLHKVGITAEAIHGNKSQNARQRALNNFKTQQTRVLVATDIAARGIDIDELAYVINYELPNVPETYVHRIGRTGRAGANGTAFSFCDTEERAFLRDIHKLIAKNIPVVEDHAWHSNGTAISSQAPAQQQGRGNGQQQRRSSNGHRGNGHNNGNRTGGHSANGGNGQGNGNGNSNGSGNGNGQRAGGGQSRNNQRRRPQSQQAVRPQ